MRDKRIGVVTGANQRVGLPVARKLMANGLTVLVGSRNFERGEAVATEIGPGAIALQLDVTDRASIAAARWIGFVAKSAIRTGRLLQCLPEKKSPRRSHLLSQ